MRIDDPHQPDRYAAPLVTAWFVADRTIAVLRRVAADNSHQPGRYSLRHWVQPGSLQAGQLRFIGLMAECGMRNSECGINGNDVESKIRVYLKIGNMTNSQGFFHVQAIFLQEYLVYCKEKRCGTGEKDRLFGRVDGFRIDPNFAFRIQHSALFVGPTGRQTEIGCVDPCLAKENGLRLQSVL